jgi:hypothetical protein
MRKLREVLRLSYSAGLSIRKISASTKISVGSIQNILKLAVQLKITWPLPEDWDDQTLALKFYPRSDAQPSAKFQEPVWTDVHMELKKKGLTKQLLWEEYTQQYLPMNKQGMHNLFQLINAMYEYRSIILTTNKEFTHWGEFFFDGNVAVPIVDRIIHHSHIFMLGGESYRLKSKLNK